MVNTDNQNHQSNGCLEIVVDLAVAGEDQSAAENHCDVDHTDNYHQQLEEEHQEEAEENRIVDHHACSHPGDEEMVEEPDDHDCHDMPEEKDLDDSNIDQHQKDIEQEVVIVEPEADVMVDPY